MNGRIIHSSCCASFYREKDFLGQSKGKILLYVNIDEFHSINRH